MIIDNYGVQFSNDGKTLNYCPRDFKGSYTISSKVTSIASFAFRGCSGLTSITIPNSVSNIGKGAFDGCSGLTSITIPNSVTNIGNFAFYGCTSLTSITIPNSVTNIGDYPFRGCTSLTSIKVEVGNTKYDSRDNCNAINETATNTLIVGCQNTVISESVTSIGWSAFAGCSGLTSVVIPKSVTSIGDWAFFGCKSLTNITIPDSVTSIGEGAFYGCTGLTNVTSKKVTVAYKAFQPDMTCRGFQYEEGKTFKFQGHPILCEQGFHACLNVLDVFNYYSGKLGKDIVVHEVKIGKIYGKDSNDSKIVTDEITIGRRLTNNDINKIIANASTVIGEELVLERAF